MHTLVINTYFEALCFRNVSISCCPCSPFCLSVFAIPDSGVSGEVALEPSSTTWICTMEQKCVIRTTFEKTKNYKAWFWIMNKYGQKTEEKLRIKDVSLPHLYIYYVICLFGSLQFSADAITPSSVPLVPTGKSLTWDCLTNMPWFSSQVK